MSIHVSEETSLEILIRWAKDGREDEQAIGDYAEQELADLPALYQPNSCIEQENRKDNER